MPNTEYTHPTEAISAIAVSDAMLAHGESEVPLHSIVGHDHTPPSVSSRSDALTTREPFDAMLHRDAIHICEADARIVGFSAETRRFEIRTVTGDLVYRPDLILLRSFGEITVVEIEGAHDDPSEDFDYGAKLDRARSVYESYGWTFEIWDRTEIHQEPRLSNARTIGWNRSAAVSAAHRMALSRAIQNGGGALAFGEAVAVLGDNGNPDCGSGRARLHALIVQKLVEIDVAKPLTLFSQVRMAQAPGLALVDILDHLQPFANEVGLIPGSTTHCLTMPSAFDDRPVPPRRGLYLDARRIDLPSERPFLVAAMDTATRQVVSTAICTDVLAGAVNAVGMAVKANPTAYPDPLIECDFCDPDALRARLAEVAPHAVVVLRGSTGLVRSWAERLIAALPADEECVL